MRILFTGGGTGGSVSPLLSIHQELKNIKNIEFLWLGTRKGLEKNLVKKAKIPFSPIFSGKLRRYFSLKNFIDPFFIILGTFQSLFIICRFKPSIILSAGGFVSFPVVLAGWILKVPSLIHQQDIIPGLANRLMAPLAKKITASFEKSLNDFPKNKVILTGNPVRLEILLGNRQKAIKFFHLEENLPTILILGGGQGAKRINELIFKILPELIKFCQIIHLAGKSPIVNRLSQITGSRYHQYEFLIKELADAYKIADLVISRAGMGALTELSNLAKPLILIPIPDSHQEENAQYFAKKNAAIVLDQKKLFSDKLLLETKQILFNKELLDRLSENIKKLSRPEASQKIINLIKQIVAKND